MAWTECKIGEAKGECEVPKALIRTRGASYARWTSEARKIASLLIPTFLLHTRSRRLLLNGAHKSADCVAVYSRTDFNKINSFISNKRKHLIHKFYGREFLNSCKLCDLLRKTYF